MASFSFPYRRHGPAGLYPTVPVEIAHLNKSVTADCLIDSGSNYCILHAELGEAIGLPFERGERISLTTVSDEMAVYLHKVELRIPGFEKPRFCKVGFARRMKTSFDLLGRIGFFEGSEITFKEDEKSVVVAEL